MQRYKIDMSMRNLSPRTQKHYTYDLEQWFIYIYMTNSRTGASRS